VVFSVSGQLASIGGSLLVFAGAVNTQTGTGSGKCYLVDNTGGCGTGTDLTYTFVACP
jgi:hypothetical protein